MRKVPKHTPGPWVAQTARTLIHIAGKHPVCSISIAPPRIPEKNLRDEQVAYAKANARLIAASPELLEALEAVVKVADRATVEFDAARAAIAKATLP